MDTIPDPNAPTKEQLAAVSLYGGLMNEALLRISAVDYCTLGKSGLQDPFIQEFAYLQLRKLCELIAIACLVAHGEIQEASPLQNEYSADKIIKRLASLNEHFFPQLVDFDLEPQEGPKGIVGRPDGMTKEEMLAIYYETDKHLHVGKLKKLLIKEKMPIRVHYPDIVARLQKFRTLIEAHTVFFSQNEKAILCFRHGGPYTVQVAIASRMNPGPPKLLSQPAPA